MYIVVFVFGAVRDMFLHAQSPVGGEGQRVRLYIDSAANTDLALTSI